MPRRWEHFRIRLQLASLEDIRNKSSEQRTKRNRACPAGSNSFISLKANTFFTHTTLHTPVLLLVGFARRLRIMMGFPGGVGTTQTWRMRINETTKTSSWSLGGTLEPWEEVTSTTTCQYGSADLEYTADVRHVFNDGQDLSYVDRGTLENAEYHFAEVTSRTGRSGHMVLELQESKDADAVVALEDSGIKPRT
ncbi:hypothetical protein BDR22DRAFT_873463 [Usnea florida]